MMCLNVLIYFKKFFRKLEYLSYYNVVKDKTIDLKSFNLFSIVLKKDLTIDFKCCILFLAVSFVL